MLEQAISLEIFLLCKTAKPWNVRIMVELLCRSPRLDLTFMISSQHNFKRLDFQPVNHDLASSFCMTWNLSKLIDIVWNLLLIWNDSCLFPLDHNWLCALPMFTSEILLNEAVISLLHFSPAKPVSNNDSQCYCVFRNNNGPFHNCQCSLIFYRKTKAEKR